jgi:hypothetical protein
MIIFAAAGALLANVNVFRVRCAASSHKGGALGKF